MVKGSKIQTLEKPYKFSIRKIKKGKLPKSKSVENINILI